MIAAPDCKCGSVKENKGVRVTLFEEAAPAEETETNEEFVAQDDSALDE